MGVGGGGGRWGHVSQSDSSCQHAGSVPYPIATTRNIHSIYCIILHALGESWSHARCHLPLWCTSKHFQVSIHFRPASSVSLWRTIDGIISKTWIPILLPGNGGNWWGMMSDLRGARRRNVKQWFKKNKTARMDRPSDRVMLHVLLEGRTISSDRLFRNRAQDYIRDYTFIYIFLLTSR